MSVDHEELEIVAACRNPDRLLPDYRGEVRVGDLRDPRYLDRVLTGVDIICHCAGWTSFSSHQLACERLYLEPSLELINRALEWPVSRFINLSSIAVAPLTDRNNPQIRGLPRKKASMLNCMLAVEDYLQAHANERLAVVNLRAGVYSGRRLHLGPMVCLVQGKFKPPSIYGSYGYLPLVDGRDLGQAFARAALAPLNERFQSLNIIGPSCPSQQEVYTYINELQAWPAKVSGLPLGYLRILNKIKGWQWRLNPANGWPSPLFNMIPNPAMDSHLAESCIGYQPQFHWKVSVMESFKNLNPMASPTIYSHKDDGIIFPE